MDGGAWKAAVHGVAEGWTWLSDFTFTFQFYALEKEMATHSSMGEPYALPPDTVQSSKKKSNLLRYLTAHNADFEELGSSKQ